MLFLILLLPIVATAEGDRGQSYFQSVVGSSALGIRSLGESAKYLGGAAQQQEKIKELEGKIQTLSAASGNDAEIAKLKNQIADATRVRDEQLELAKGEFTQSNAAFKTAKDNLFSQESVRGPPEVKTGETGKERLPIDKGIGRNDMVCLGGNCSKNPIGRDIKHYTEEVPVGRFENPQTLHGISEAIRNTPDEIRTVYLDAHGSKSGSTYFPGLGEFSSDSPEMTKIYGSVRQLNEERVTRGVAPVDLTLMQCYGASCGQRAADVSGTTVRAGDTKMSIPQNAKQSSLTAAGGSIYTFSPNGAEVGGMTSATAGSTSLQTASVVVANPSQAGSTPVQTTPTVVANPSQVVSATQLSAVSTTAASGASGSFNNLAMLYAMNAGAAQNAASRKQPPKEDSKKTPPPPSSNNSLSVLKFDSVPLPDAPAEVSLLTVRRLRGMK